MNKRNNVKDSIIAWANENLVGKHAYVVKGKHEGKEGVITGFYSYEKWGEGTPYVKVDLPDVGKGIAVEWDHVETLARRWEW